MARASNTYFHLNKVIVYDFTSFRRYWMYLGTQPWGTRTLFIKRDHCFFFLFLVEWGRGDSVSLGTDPPVANHNPATFSVPQILKSAISPLPGRQKGLIIPTYYVSLIKNLYWLQNSLQTLLSSKLRYSCDLTEPKCHKTKH